MVKPYISDIVVSRFNVELGKVPEGRTPNYLEIAREVYKDCRDTVALEGIEREREPRVVRDSILSVIEQRFGKGYVQGVRRTLENNFPELKLL